MIPVLLAIIRAIVLFPLLFVGLIVLADAGVLANGTPFATALLLLVCGHAVDIVYHTFQRK